MEEEGEKERERERGRERKRVRRTEGETPLTFQVRYRVHILSTTGISS